MNNANSQPKLSKKLTLSKETLRELTNLELQGVAGGEAFTQADFCRTLVACPTYFCISRGKPVCPIQG